MKEKEDIKRYAQQFVNLFKTKKHKSIVVNPDRLTALSYREFGFSGLEIKCLNLIIGKHLKPDSKFFKTKNNDGTKSFLATIALEDELEEFLTNEILKNQTPARSRLTNLRPLLGEDEFKSSKLRKTSPTSYFIDEFFNNPPSHLFKHNFKKFLYEILKTLFEGYEMHNYTAGNLIRGLTLGFSTTSKKTLSIDSSYVLSLLDCDNKNALYAGEGYSPNYPNDLLAYLTYFGEHNVKWTGLYNKKGAFEIKQKFDFIYTRIDGNNFGYSYMNNSYYAGIETDTNPDLYIDTIEQTHKALNKSGTAMFFIENQFLYENVDRVKQLVDRSFLSGVISLRNYSLLILKKHSKNVKIFDGSTYIKAVFHGKAKSLIDDNALIRDFKKQKHKNLRIIPTKTLKSAVMDYIINPNFIFYTPQDSEADWTRLSECSKILKSKTYSYGEIKNKNRIVKVRDLSKDASKLILDDSYQNESTINKYLKVNQSALLLAKVGNKLKPTVFDFEEEPIYIHHNVVALVADNRKTSISFLAQAVFDAEKKGYYTSFYRGATIPYLTQADVLHKIKIDLPNIDTQKAQLEKRLLEKIQTLKVQGQEVKLKLEEQLIDAFMDIDHRIKNDLKNIKSSTNKIYDFFKDNNELQKKVNSVWAKYFNKKEEIYQPLKNIRNNIKKSTKLLTIIRDKKSFLNTDDYPLEDITIKKLLMHFNEKFILINNPLFAVKLYFNDKEFVETDLSPLHENIAIRANHNQIEYMINELITNAEKYAGFTKSNKGLIAIRIMFEQDGASKLKLLLENNGKPFKEGFDSVESFVKNKNTSDKKNSHGYGGSMVKSIADRYFIEFSISSQPKEEFPVKFIFKFQTHQLD